MRIFNLTCKIACIVSIVVSVFSVNVQAANSSDTCELYPITLPYSLLDSASSGDSFNKILFGNQENNYSWLTWNGNTSESTAKSSLVSPGNDENYINPNDNNDLTLNVNDWASGLSSFPTTGKVKKKIKLLFGTDVNIPLWSQTITQNGQVTYQIVDFGVINISAYSRRNGKLSFTYKGLSACDEVSNSKPVANAQSVNTNQNTVLSITLSGTDTENDPLTYIINSNPTNGTLSGNSTAYTYTPNNGYTGTDSFTFKVNDGNEDSDVMTVSITVNGVSNAKPVANVQSVNTIQDTALSITLLGTDADSDPLSYVIVSTTTNGILSGSDTNYTYTPNNGYTGSDSFTFKVNDGTEYSDVVAVSITVTTSDLDGDGIHDLIDLCPQTPSGVDVNENGCSIEQTPRLGSKLPKTGSSTSAHVFDDGDLQKGTERVFVRDDINEVVVDQTNNLIWQDNIDARNLLFNWSDADDYCQNLELAGKNDWHLPTRFQLLYLLDMDQNIPQGDAKIDSSFQNISDDSQWKGYWTQNKKLLQFEGGSSDWVADWVGFVDAKIADLYRIGYLTEINNVRCVSGNKSFSTKLDYVSEGLYVAPENRLMWEIGNHKNEIFSWAEAIEHCNNLSIASATDWRLPNINELHSVISNNELRVDESLFWESWIYWTSTMSNHDLNSTVPFAYRLNHDSGNMVNVESQIITANNYVICVREYVAPQIGTIIYDQNPFFGDNITFDASSVSSVDSSSFSFKWIYYNQQGDMVIVEQATFTTTALPLGTSTVSLEVIDTHGVRVIKEFTVTVVPDPSDLPPIAIAGSDQTITLTKNDNINDIEVITLSAIDSNDDKEIVKYEWYENGIFLDIQSQFNIYNDNKYYWPLWPETHQIDITYLDNIDTNYVYTLKVYDANGSVASDDVNVTVTFVEALQAEAGDNLTVSGGELIRLDGSNSTSGNYDIIANSWSMKSKPASALNQQFDPTEQIEFTLSTEGVYEMKYWIKDENNKTSSDTLFITVTSGYSLNQCSVDPIGSDDNNTDNPPYTNIEWVGSNFTDVAEIEKAFFTARLNDNSVDKFLKMPTQATWDSWSPQQKGLYLVNSEREARGIKPFDGINNEVVDVSSQYANNFIVNSSASVYADERLNENITIRDNCENCSKPMLSSLSRIYQNTDNFPSESESIIEAVYNMLYNSASIVFGTPHWPYRPHLLQTSFNENNGDIYREGLLGFGVATGDNINLGYAVIVSAHTIDPASTWDHSNTITVDTSDSHNCNKLTLNLNPQAPSLEGLSSLVIGTSNVVLKPQTSQAIEIVGHYSNGSIQDLTEYISFAASDNSIASISDGLITALNTGSVKIDVSANGISSNIMAVHVNDNIEPPTANAGEDRSVPFILDKEYIIDGSASSDDAGIVKYQWKLEGEVVSENASFSFDVTDLWFGTYEYFLTVTDKTGLTAFDSVIITVRPEELPKANAGSDQTIRFGSTILFDGSESTFDSDYDTDKVKYRWKLNGDLLSQKSSFSSNELLPGVWTITLKVIDPSGDFSSTDSMEVTVLPELSMKTCKVANVENDTSFVDTYPEDNIDYIGDNYSDVSEIEKAFNYARQTDNSIYKYLKLPSQVVWDSLTSQEQGLYIINAEREARSIKPYEGISDEVIGVAQDYADYLLENNEAISHYRSSDNASPEDRLLENSTISANLDSVMRSESIAQLPFGSGEDLTSKELVIKSIFFWIYSDTIPFNVLTPWGHRAQIIQTGFNENSGPTEFAEGLLGFGIAIGDYQPGTNPPQYRGGVVVLNNIDPSSTWDHTNTTTIDTSSAHGCNDEVIIPIDNEVAPVANLRMLVISPNQQTLTLNETLAMKVTGLYDDGTSQDLTSYVNFVPDDKSIVQIDNGFITVLNAGVVKVSASVNGILSNSITLNVLSTQTQSPDISNLQNTFAEPYLEYIPANATITSYDPKAFSIFTGLVRDRDGLPLADVDISFHHQPEYGSVKTDTDGRFILAGQAGEKTLVYSKENYLTIHRTIISASTNWSSLDDVMLLNIDTKKTAIDLTSNEVQVHRSTIIIDGYGERSTTLVFNGVSSAMVTSPDGSRRSLNKFFLHATEYELPSSMPADLPKETAFTYCAELQIPGVADEESVNFNSPVTMYVDNFLNFDVGEIVPIGYYDRFDGQWKSSENGVVVKLLDANSDGLIDGLDYTGDGIADDVNGSGNTTDDAVGLENYQVGALYWRGNLTHFTPVDFNWSANTDGNEPDVTDPVTDKEDPKDNEKECVSSYIKPKALTLHEDINITGTGLTLHYSSQRTHGYHHKISANVSGADIPFGVIEMIAVLEIGGNRFEQSFTPSTYQDVEFIWDGTSPTGELVEGVVRGRISIGYKYQADYYSAGNVATSGQPLDSFDNAWAQWGSTPTSVIAREDIIRWSNNVVTVLNAPKSEIANGWSISNHHKSTPFNLIYRGDGEAEQVNNTTNIFKTGISQSQYVGDDGFYQKGGLDVDYSIDAQGILLDKVTGLKWQYQVTNQVEFVQKSDAIAYCENLQLGDNGEVWRLPTSKEIGYSIYKAGDQHEFPIYRLVAKQLWGESTSNINLRSIPALCVSGTPLDEQYSAGLQRNNVDEVVVDESNGLMWQDDSAAAGATYLWSEAVDYCENLSHANYDDWRLPNINELLYTLPNTVFVNQTVLNFPEGEPWRYDVTFRKPYWTSTPNIADPEQQAWAVESLSFSYHAYDKATENYNVRCVRDDLTRSRSPYVFDHKGRHIKTIDINSGIILTTFNYDNEGRLSTIKDQFDNTIVIHRDENGKATEIVSPDGYITKLTVDEFNDLVRAEYDDNSAYDFVYQNSLMVEEMDVRNNVFTRNFDTTGRITQSFDPEGGQWDFFSNKDELSGVLSYGFTTAEGNTYQSLLSFLENGDKETVTTFKDLSQLTRTQQSDDLKTSVQSSGVLTVIDNVVDVKTKKEIPHVITTTLPSGLTSVTQLDKTYAENGTDTSKTTITVTNNAKVSTLVTDTVAGSGLSMSAQSRTSSTSYNPITQQVISQQVTGLTANNYQYDNRGRLTTITSGDRLTTYAYDDVTSEGGLTSVTDAMNQMTEFDYDLMGRLIQTTYHDGSVLTQDYDNNGNLASITPPNQPTHYFSYNSVDKETDYTPPVVTGVADPSTVYDYDRDRKLTAITRPDAQLLTFNYTANTDQLASIDIPRGSYSYAYDVYANITTITAPDTDELSFTYDGNLPLSQTWAGTVVGSVSQTYNTDFIVNQQCINGSNCIDYLYDLDNLITSAGSLNISRESQKAGLINGSTLDNVTMVRTNDSFGEMSDEVTRFNTATLLSADYLRDKLGRITERNLDIQGTSSTDIYSYNDAGRLASVVNGAVTTSYVFDDNGNRLSKTIDDGTTPIVTNGIYDEQDRLTSYGNCTYLYTKNGELTQKTCGTAITQYSYDVLGNLMQVTLPDNTKIDYLIDGLNRRIGKKVNDTLQQGFLYGDQLNPVAELDSSNNIISQFVYGTKVNVPDYMVKGGVTYKIITDQLGSPKLVVNASTGVIAQKIDYDEFGIITQDTNPGFQPFGFAGGLVDNQTGVTRFGARDYDAVTGRWTSKDPIRFAGGDSNIYGYVFSDPVNFIDPNGEKSVTVKFYLGGRGFSITWGEGSDNKWFFTGKVGLGVGRSISVDPNGEFNNSDSSSNKTHVKIGFYGEAGVTAGPISIGEQYFAGAVLVIDQKTGEMSFPYKEGFSLYDSNSANTKLGASASCGLLIGFKVK